jgi:hypothetical protein
MVGEWRSLITSIVTPFPRLNLPETLMAMTGKIPGNIPKHSIDSIPFHVIIETSNGL